MKVLKVVMIALNMIIILGAILLIYFEVRDERPTPWVIATNLFIAMVNASLICLWLSM